MQLKKLDLSKPSAWAAFALSTTASHGRKVLGEKSFAHAHKILSKGSRYFLYRRVLGVEKQVLDDFQATVNTFVSVLGATGAQI
jgi:hypothetical protein